MNRPTQTACKLCRLNQPNGPILELKASQIIAHSHTSIEKGKGEVPKHRKQQSVQTSRTTISEMAADRDTNISKIEDDEEEELDEDAGEVIESAPPLKVGEEREINSSGIKKKLLKCGHGWETPDFGDEVTVHYVGSLLDGSKFDSSRDKGEPITFKLGHGEVLTGLDNGLVTMKKGELALFTLPPDSENGAIGVKSFPTNSDIQLEVELLFWISVVDVCRDGGIIKKVLEKGERNEQPNDLDEVMVKYQVMLTDGSVVAKTPEEGLEFYLKDGHFCSALPKVLRTMKRGELVKLVVQPQYAFGEKGLDFSNGYPAIPPDSVLNINLKLISFKPVIDITGDLKILKKILKEGEGTETPNEGAAAIIRYSAKLEDGTIFESRGFNGDFPLEFVIDEEQVVVGLDRATSTMKKGELSIVTVKPEYGFGSTEVKRDLSIVPPCSTLVYEVEMVDFTKEKAPWELNNHEKLRAAEKKKEEGNRLFKSGKYQQAAKRYDKAVDYVTEDGSFGEDDKKLVVLRVSCWSNHAACSLKQNNFHEAIKLCSKVLDIEGHNVKALYRRAQAYMSTADFYLSELDVKKALEVDPNNKEVKTLQKTLKQLQSEINKRDASIYTNMFSSMRKDSTVVTKRLKVEKAETE